MVVIILLLILAVLLFGSSVVTGALGAILGFLVAAVAFIYLEISFDLTLADILFYAFGFVVLIAIMLFSLAALYDQFNPPEKLMRKHDDKKGGFVSWHRDHDRKDDQT